MAPVEELDRIIIKVIEFKHSLPLLTSILARDISLNYFFQLIQTYNLNGKY